MKLITLTILIFSFLVLNTAEKKAEISAKANKGKDFPGMSPIPQSVAYGYATSDNYVLQNAAGFKNAEIIPKIPINLNHPFTGVMAEATGFVTDKFYYNGQNNLNAIHVECNIYSSNPQGCVHNSKCGWCGDNNNCIAGNTSGPLAPCMRNTFLYTAPTQQWNPLRAGSINILAVDQKGLPQNIITHSPDMNKIDVNNPYK